MNKRYYIFIKTPYGLDLLEVITTTSHRNATYFAKNKYTKNRFNYKYDDILVYVESSQYVKLWNKTHNKRNLIR